MTLLIIGSTDKIRREEIGKHLKNCAPVDILETNPEETGVDNVRDWLKWLTLTGSGRKNLVIQSASDLSIEAQNALLKTLEDPPGAALLILEAPSENGLLPTVLSRTTLIDLGQENFVPPEMMANQIAILDKANIPTKFNIAQALANDKVHLETWLNEAIQTLHQKLITGQSVQGKITGLLTAKAHLKANCNARLVLENLFLNW